MPCSGDTGLHKGVGELWETPTRRGLCGSARGGGQGRVPSGWPRAGVGGGPAGAARRSGFVLWLSRARGGGAGRTRRGGFVWGRRCGGGQGGAWGARTPPAAPPGTPQPSRTHLRGPRQVQWPLPRVPSRGGRDGDGVPPWVGGVARGITAVSARPGDMGAVSVSPGCSGGPGCPGGALRRDFLGETPAPGGDSPASRRGRGTSGVPAGVPPPVRPPALWGTHGRPTGGSGPDPAWGKPPLAGHCPCAPTPLCRGGTRGDLGLAGLATPEGPPVARLG